MSALNPRALNQGTTVIRLWKGHRDTYIGWFSVGVPGGLLMSGIINRQYVKQNQTLIGPMLKTSSSNILSECVGTDLYSR